MRDESCIAEERVVCIAIQTDRVVAGRAAGGKIVSQYKIVLQQKGKAAGQRAAGRWACVGRWAGRGSRRWGARARRERVRGAAAVHGQRAAGTGARRERHGGKRWARGLARAVHSVHSAWFSTRFFDSVFFLNH